MPFDNIPSEVIFVIVALVISALQSLGKGKKKREERTWEEVDPGQYEEPSTLEDLYEEARREILDRQNRREPQPDVVREQLEDYRSSPPPPPVSAPPPLPKAEIPPRRDAPSWSAEPAKPLQEVRKPQLTAEEKAALERFRQSGSPKKASGDAGARIRKLLANPNSARDAVILAEILNRPRV